MQELRLRVLVACRCRGFCCLATSDRSGENVVVTETRVRIPLGHQIVFVDGFWSGFKPVQVIRPHVGGMPGGPEQRGVARTVAHRGDLLATDVKGRHLEAASSPGGPTCRMWRYHASRERPGLEVLLSPASQDSGREQDFQSRVRFEQEQSCCEVRFRWLRGPAITEIDWAHPPGDFAKAGSINVQFPQQAGRHPATCRCAGAETSRSGSMRPRPPLDQA